MLDNQLIKIMRISHLRLIYCYTIDSKDYNNLDKSLAVEIVYGNKKKLVLDYKNPYFPYYLNRIKEVYNKGRPNQWSVHFKIYETLYLPEQYKECGVRISIQENTKLFPGRKAENRNIEWNVAGTIQCLTLSEDIENLPDIFIYITLFHIFGILPNI